MAWSALIKANNLLNSVRINRASFILSFFKMSSSSSDSSYIYKSHYSDVEEPNLPLHQLIWKNVNKWPQHTAIECAVSGKKYSYSELHLKSRRFGASLLKLGLKHGDSLGVFLPNTPDYPIACLGSLEIGLVVNTINNLFTLDELTRQMKDTDSICIVCDPTNIKIVQEAKKYLKKDIYIICTHNIIGSAPEVSEDVIFFENMVDDSVDTSDLTDINSNLTDIALISYSSGTTGLPKGVCLTHRSIGTNLTQINHPILSKLIPSYGDHQDVVPACLPFFHSYGSIGILLLSFSNGSKVVTFPKFDPQTFLRVIATSKNLFLMLVPPLVQFLANSPQVTPDLLRNVREVITAAAPVSFHDMDKFRSKCSIPVSQAYGMTEASPLITLKTTDDSEQNPSSVGKLLPNTNGKVIDIETGKTLPHNTTGILCFKGPQLMKCYLNNPKATAETIDSEGWLHSGDVGYCDEDGFFYVVDRLKEMIKVNGFQVSPAELEGVLRKHPDIIEAGVVGAVSKRTGETPVAFVQVKPGSQPKSQEIIQHVASLLSKHKHISDVKFLKSIPKTASGKILRKELKKLL